MAGGVFKVLSGARRRRGVANRRQHFDRVPPATDLDSRSERCDVQREFALSSAADGETVSALVVRERACLDGSWCGLGLEKPPDAARNVPTVEQVGRLLVAPDVRTPTGLRNRAILELLYGTGIRVNECHLSDLDSLDLGGSRFHVQGKGSKDRMLPLGPCLRQSLSRYLGVREQLGAHPSEQALFIGKGGKRLGLGSLDQVVRKSARAIGLEGLRASHFTPCVCGASVGERGRYRLHPSLAGSRVFALDGGLHQDSPTGAVPGASAYAPKSQAQGDRPESLKIGSEWAHYL